MKMKKGMSLFFGLFLVAILALPVYAVTYYPQASCADQASTSAGCTKALLNAIGTTKKATIEYRHNTPGTTTTYTVAQNADWSAYTNVTFKIASGAMISRGTFTVNIPNRNIGDVPFQWLTGSGAVTLSGNVSHVWADEFTVNVTPGTTNMTTAIQYAVNALTKGTVKFLPKDHRITAAITLHAYITLEGDNHSTSSVSVAPGYALNAFEWAAGGSTYGGLVIRYLTVTGNAVTPATGYGFYFLNIFNIVMEHCTVGYFKEGFHLEGGWGHFIKDAYAGNSTAYGFFFGGQNSVLDTAQTDGGTIGLYLAASFGSRIVNSIFEGATTASVKITGDATGLSIIGNKLVKGIAAGTPDGIIDANDANQYKMIISGNYIIVLGNGIKLTNTTATSRTAIITSNHIIAISSGIELANYGENIVANNWVSADVGIYIRTLDNTQGNLVSGNTIFGTTAAIKHDVAGSQTKYSNNYIYAGTTKYNLVSGTPYITHDNTASTLTLGANVASTTISDTRVTANSVINLTPTSANAAADQGSATGVWISAKSAGTSFTVTHPNNVNADKTYNYTIFN